jgi:hypothetical protein
VNVIFGRPEGRPGVWLVTPETARGLIDALPEEWDRVHNLLSSGGGGVQLGADWHKDDVFELLARPGVRLALVFPPNLTFRHQLVALDDEHRWAFDVGEIPESVMAPEPEKVSVQP